MPEVEFEWKLKRLGNFGYTDQGAAIVDAIWFSPIGSYQQVGMVLILTPDAQWKAYIGIALAVDEQSDAKLITETGAKLSCALAQAAFPGRFKEAEYGGRFD